MDEGNSVDFYCKPATGINQLTKHLSLFLWYNWLVRFIKSMLVYWDTPLSTEESSLLDTWIQYKSC